MSEARIFQPAKTAMQSGRGNTKKWVLEFEPAEARQADSLMGWIGSEGTNGQVKLRFETRDEAVAFAKKNGFGYTVTEPKVRRVKPKDYSANFAYDRIR